MPIMIATDKYIIENDTPFIILSRQDAEQYDILSQQSYVKIIDDQQQLEQLQYDREDCIEIAWRAYATQLIAENNHDILLIATSYGIHNGLLPQYVGKLDTTNNYSSFDNNNIPDNTIIMGMLDTYCESIANKKQGKVDNYLNKNYLQEFFNRNMITVSSDHIDDQEEKTLRDLIDNNDTLFIKNTYRKDVNGIVSTRNITHNNIDMIVYDMINSNPIFEHWCWQLPSSITLQEVIDIGYETRFFCVHGTIVSASGRVIDYVPDDNSMSDPYYYGNKSTQYMSKTNDGQQVVINNHYDSQLEMAKNIAALLQEKEEYPVNCTIDIGVNMINNKPILIELNSISNSGFYGCDPVIIYQQLWVKTLGYNGLTFGELNQEFNNKFNYLFEK